MVLHIVRTFFLLVVLAIIFSFAFQQELYKQGTSYITGYILIPAVLAFALVLVDILWERKRLQVLSGLFFGVLAGLAIAYMLTLIVDLVVTLLPAPTPVAATGLAPPAPIRAKYGDTAEDRSRYENARLAYLQALEAYDQQSKAYTVYQGHVKTVQLAKLLLGSAAVFMCVTFVLQTKDDFRFVIPYVEFAKETKGSRPMLLDTSVIIDGRIADIADTGMLDSEVIVPRFILAELQAIADSEDKLKRNRGRRGLDILNRLQGNDKIDIQILEARVASVADAADADAKLVALAKHLGGRVVTNDYNLNKVAQLRGVNVININDLANALKPIVLPGESLGVKIIKPGEEAGQGVGYLEDGTMVVAEQGRDCIGKEIVISVTSVLQTSAGRMIFGRLDADRSFARRDKRS